MRRGTLHTAAGRLIPGTSPCLTHSLRTYFPQPATLLFVFLRKLSNRHLVRLEITATPIKSATSLFLIDPKQAQLRTSFSALQLVTCLGVADQAELAENCSSAKAAFSRRPVAGQCPVSRQWVAKPNSAPTRESHHAANICPQTHVSKVKAPGELLALGLRSKGRQTLRRPLLRAGFRESPFSLGANFRAAPHTRTWETI
jgi:hypothetical protein